MAAMCFEFTALILILGLTGWGKLLVERIPNGLKAGIILGAALAAFYQVFFEDFDAYLMLTGFHDSSNCSMRYNYFFLILLKELLQRINFFEVIGSPGLLPGFLVAGLVAFFLGELTFNIEWGFKIPAIMEA